jgi:hypothetical protein
LIVLSKHSLIIAKSAVPPYIVAPMNPSGAMYLFSGEVDGDVIKYPFLSVIIHSKKNSEAPFIIG